MATTTVIIVTSTKVVTLPIPSATPSASSTTFPKSTSTAATGSSVGSLTLMTSSRTSFGHSSATIAGTVTTMAVQGATNGRPHSTTAVLIAVAVIVIVVVIIFAVLCLWKVRKAKKSHKGNEAGATCLPPSHQLDSVAPVIFTTTESHPSANPVHGQGSPSDRRCSGETSWSELIRHTRTQHNPFDSRSAINNPDTPTCPEPAIRSVRQSPEYSRSRCGRRGMLRVGQVNRNFGQLVAPQIAENEEDIEMSRLDDNGSIISMYALPIAGMSKEET